MHFRIITKPGCSFCSQAKTLITTRGHSYSEDLRTSPADIASFKAAGYRSFPQIFDGEKHVGGYAQLAGYIASGDRVYATEDDF